MKIAIIGAGAAGCFAAANIPFKDGVEVAVFEKAAKALQKVRASGGGRCNVTHECFDIPELITRYPRGKQLLRRSLYQFTPQDTIEWFNKRGITLKTEEDGRMFPVTDSSETIIDCIWRQMMLNKVQVYFHKSVSSLESRGEQLLLKFADGSDYLADKVLVSIGGFPKAEQYKWLEAIGHTIQTPVPSLFTFNIPKHPVTELMGVSVSNAAVKIAGTKISTMGPLLITHWGMSGPAVLKASAIGARELAERKYEFKVLINWLGQTQEGELKEQLQELRQEHGKLHMAGKNPFQLPKRLWEYLLGQCGIGDNVRWGELPASKQNKLVEHLLRNSYDVKGKTTFKEEFVTCGGVSLSEIDAQTMQSRKVPGLYFAGEILDVDGITGGYNFQHAWSSGWITAQHISSDK